MQPVRVLDPGHRVGDSLHGSWDGDDLLNGTAQALLVVGPVHQLPHIWRILCMPACTYRRRTFIGTYKTTIVSRHNGFHPLDATLRPSATVSTQHATVFDSWLVFCTPPCMLKTMQRKASISAGFAIAKMVAI